MIGNYFEKIAKLFSECPLISSVTLKTNIYDIDFGYIEIKSEFIDGSKLQVFELVELKENAAEVLKYRYHFERSDRKIMRWDNAPHHKEISTFPHHKHINGDVLDSEKPSIEEVLELVCSKVDRR